MPRRPAQEPGDPPFSNKDELHLIKATMNTPGWKLLMLRWESMRQALISTLQEDLRTGRPVHAMVRQFAIDLSTQMMTDPRQNVQALEAMISEQLDQQASLIEQAQRRMSHA